MRSIQRGEATFLRSHSKGASIVLSLLSWGLTVQGVLDRSMNRAEGREEVTGEDEEGLEMAEFPHKLLGGFPCEQAWGTKQESHHPSLCPHLILQGCAGLNTVSMTLWFQEPT